jgi:MinD-like ATPase involved in chromosome partitioning or flagellar assembly
MTSHNGRGDHDAANGHRRRSPYEELGQSVDVLDGAVLDASESNGSDGDLAYAGAPLYGHRIHADETESFIAALREDPPPLRNGRAGHAARPRSVRPPFESGPNALPLGGDLIQNSTESGVSTGDLPAADSGLEEALHELEIYRAPELYGALGDVGIEPSTGDLPEPVGVPQPTVESLLPAEAPEPLETPREAKPGKASSAELTAESMLQRRRDLPGRGWRRTVFALSGGHVNVGPSKAEIRERELINRARTPLHGCHRIAIISLKGGVGKTTTTTCLGSMFATLRGDRVIAMDANPDRGTLGEKIPRSNSRTVRDLVDNAERLNRYADVRDFTSQAPSRLEVLASDSDPFASMAFSETDYRVGVGLLESYYNLILADCGTGLLHSAMVGVLDRADSLIIVTTTSLDGARSASATLDWLEHHGYRDLVRQSVAVISTVHSGGGSVDVSKLEDHFASRCRAVVRIPFDPHLEAGGIIDLDELEEPTYDAYLQLAAEVAGVFASEPRIG